LGGFGFGNCEIQTPEKITTIKDIQEISRHIEKDNGYQQNSLVIISFQLLDR
jgi:hypothetical protein